ncbi:MAG TPA: hypothetical protein VGF55_31455, partial [Gemmataceae bacterium]
MNATLRFATALAVWLGTAVAGPAADGVFVRFRLRAAEPAKYYVVLGGYIHQPNWVLRPAVVPAGADKDASRRAAAGEFTPWFDLAAHAGKDLHPRLNRAGG